METITHMLVDVVRALGELSTLLLCIMLVVQSICTWVDLHNVRVRVNLLSDAVQKLQKEVKEIQGHLGVKKEG